MSKLTKAKDDIMFLKRKLKEKEEALGFESFWFNGQEYKNVRLKREINGLKRLIYYTEHFIYTEQMKKNLKDLGT